MAEPPEPKIEVAFPVNASLGETAFVIGDPDRGVIGNSTYTIAGDVWVDVTDDALRGFNVNRGRERFIDEFQSGTANFILNNRDRTYDPTNTGSPYYGNLTPMRRVRVTADIDGDLFAVFGGYVAEWPVRYEANATHSEVDVECVDSFAVLAVTEIDEVAARDAGDLAGARISRALDFSEVNFPASRDIDDGVSTFAATTYGENTLAYLQNAARSENGWLFVAADGTLAFRDRHSALNSEPTVTFGGSGGIPIHRIGLETSNALLWNRIVAQREGGAIQVAEDADSRAEYLTRTLQRTELLLEDDTQVAQLAAYLLGRFAQPEVRITHVTVKLNALTPMQQRNVLGLEITDRVDVTFTPPGVVGVWPETWDDEWGGAQSAIERTAVVEGIRHQFVRRDWTVTLSLSAADTLPYFRVGDETYGVIGENRIAY